MPIPIEAGSFTYTPECLSELPDAPVFTIRYGTHRELPLVQSQQTKLGLVSYDEEDMHARRIWELRNRWTSDEIDIEVAVDALERHRAAEQELRANTILWVNENAKVAEDNAGLPEGESATELSPFPTLDFDAVEADEIDLLKTKIKAESEVLRLMDAENERWQREAPKIRLANLLVETSLPIEIKRDRQGVITEKTFLDMELELATISLQVPDLHQGMAFYQLGRKAMNSFRLTKEEEKNSPSPLPTDTEGSGSINPAVSPSSITTTSKGSPTSELEPVPTPAKSSAKATPT